MIYIPVCQYSPRVCIRVSLALDRRCLLDDVIGMSVCMCTDLLYFVPTLFVTRLPRRSLNNEVLDSDLVGGIFSSHAFPYTLNE